MGLFIVFIEFSQLLCVLLFILLLQKERNKKRDSEKYNHCKRKQQEDRTWEGIPEETRKIIRGVNIFRKKITPEKPLGPMVCSEEIELNENEIAFLNKGPGYMMRLELDDVEFELEMEKMVTKRKFREKEEEMEIEKGSGKEKTEREREEDKRIESEMEKLVTQSRMIYNKGSKCVDMGNLKASDYKYNRYIHLLRSTDAQRETLHILRKEEMKKVYRAVKMKMEEVAKEGGRREKSTWRPEGRIG